MLNKLNASAVCCKIPIARLIPAEEQRRMEFRWEWEPDSSVIHVSASQKITIFQR